MKKVATLMVLLFLLTGCAAIKGMLNIWTVKVSNQLVIDGKEISGVEILVNSAPKFTLDYGKEKSFDINVGQYRSGSAVTVTASHSSFATNPQFTLIVAGNYGSIAKLILTSRKILNSDYPQILCTNCSSLTDKGTPDGSSPNPLQ